MNKHLVVVSVDALVFEDLEYAKTLPIFGKIINDGACIERVKTIYPSLTHCVHATLITGAPAGITGIVSNEEFEPGNLNRKWFNSLSQIKCDTIFDAAHRAGLTTAACRWPVTANAGGLIDYLIPEIMPEDMEYKPSEPIEIYKKLGTSDCVLPIVETAIKKFGHSNEHPEYDDFQIFCAAEIIKKFKPDILFTHPGFVDSERHRTGLFSEYVKKAIDRTELWLEELFKAIKDAGLEDITDFVVLSDHGHLNVNRMICPNVYFADEGLLKVGTNGELESWEAYSSSCALSAQIYLSRPDDLELYYKVYNMLEKMAEEKIYGFDRVFTKEELLRDYGLSGDFSFALETDGNTAFCDDWVRPIVRNIEQSDFRLGHSKHGHLPEKGPQPTFLGIGPSFKSKARIPYGDILNHASTLAKICGLTLKDSIGHPEETILNLNADYK